MVNFTKKNLFFILFLFINTLLIGQSNAQKLLFDVAYYDEYMPYERLEKNVKMMQETGINVVRIAESTWSTVEPQDNVFDFSHIDRVLNAMQKGGIKIQRYSPSNLRCVV